MEILAIIVFVAIVFGIIGMAIGDHGGKKNGSAGFALGAVLGPIGCVIAAMLHKSDADGAPIKEPSPTEANAARIAALEAQLAQLKAPQQPEATSVDGEAPVPTYNLN